MNLKNSSYMLIKMMINTIPIMILLGSIPCSAAEEPKLSQIPAKELKPQQMLFILNNKTGKDVYGYVYRARWSSARQDPNYHWGSGRNLKKEETSFVLHNNEQQSIPGSSYFSVFIKLAYEKPDNPTSVSYNMGGFSEKGGPEMLHKRYIEAVPLHRDAAGNLLGHAGEWVYDPTQYTIEDVKGLPEIPALRDYFFKEPKKAPESTTGPGAGEAERKRSASKESKEKAGKGD